MTISPHTWTNEDVTRRISAAKLNAYIRDQLQSLQDEATALALIVAAITPGGPDFTSEIAELFANDEAIAVILADLQAQIDAFTLTVTTATWNPVLDQNGFPGTPSSDASYTVIPGVGVAVCLIQFNVVNAGSPGFGGAGNDVTMTLPLTAVNFTSGADSVVGTGYFFDNSTGSYYAISLEMIDDATVRFIATGGPSGVLGQTFNAAPATTGLTLGPGDVFQGVGFYYVDNP